jgi:hypothetical protein
MVCNIAMLVREALISSPTKLVSFAAGVFLTPIVVLSNSSFSHLLRIIEAVNPLIDWHGHQ